MEAPAGEAYNVDLYNADEQIQDFGRGTGDDSIVFETDGYDPGSYMIVVSYDGEVEAIHPHVISAYTVDVSAPDAAERGDTIAVSATLEPVAGEEPIETVRVVIGNDDRERRLELTEMADGVYEASVTLDQLPANEYALYVVVQGPDEVFNRQELIGVSDSTAFELTAADDSDDGSGSSSSGSSGGGSGGSGGGSTSASSTATETVSGETTAPPATDEDGTESAATDAGQTSGVSHETDRSTTRDRDVITPADGEASPSRTEAAQRRPDVPILVFAILSLLWLVRD